MSVSSVSSLSTVQMLVSQLNNQTSGLNDLALQLSSQKQHADLTDYSAGDAVNLLNLQSSATQRQAYVGVIKTVQSRLSVYDNTMSDMESIINQAQSIASNSQNYNASTAANISSAATNYLKSVQLDLNQQVNGRYIYGGARYTTAPVADLANLAGAPSATTVTSPVLPTYDTAYTASQLTLTTSGQNITLGGSVTAPQQVSVAVSGQTYTYTVQAGDTSTSIAAGLATLISANVAGTTSSGGVLTVGGSGTIQSASANMTSIAAYSLDSATVDSGIAIQYGVSSDNPAFQQMIAGLRFMQSAGQSNNAATYGADMSQALSLLSSAATSLQAVHTSVANNINLMTSEATSQNSQLTNLANQVSDIQGVNVTQVSAEITALQAVLEASFSVTGTIEKLSIVSYL